MLPAASAGVTVGVATTVEVGVATSTSSADTCALKR